MAGVLRLDLKGQLPFVEHRKSVDRFFVVYPDLKYPLSSQRGYELVIGFTHRWTACELALGTYHGDPFFEKIPVVPYGTPYPRPGLMYPQHLIDKVELHFSED